jgi:hypothetical protein
LLKAGGNEEMIIVRQKGFINFIRNICHFRSKKKPIIAVEDVQMKIPARLSHHTSLSAAYSILGEKEQKGICFRAISNKFKNDDAEMELGIKLLNRIKRLNTHLLLNKIGGYEQSASISFMEGKTNEHMLSEYGKVRLEFDFRKLFGIGILGGDIVKCEYMDEKTFNHISSMYESLMTNFLKNKSMENIITLEGDILHKIFTIKDSKWRNEEEWRIVIDTTNKEVHQTSNGYPYVNYTIVKKALKGVTIFYDDSDEEEMRAEAAKMKKFLILHKYNAYVKVASRPSIKSKE